MITKVNTLFFYIFKIIFFFQLTEKTLKSITDYAKKTLDSENNNIQAALIIGIATAEYGKVSEAR
jgi:hypothetical protein